MNIHVGIISWAYRQHARLFEDVIIICTYEGGSILHLSKVISSRFLMLHIPTSRFNMSRMLFAFNGFSSSRAAINAPPVL